MEEFTVLGIGGAGSAIVRYIEKETNGEIPLSIIDSDSNNTSDSIPVSYYSPVECDSIVSFQNFLSVTVPCSVTNIVVISGFTGKQTPTILKSLIGYAHQRKIDLTITGVTPFSFEGKKRKEAEALVAELSAITDSITTFSNSELIASIAPSTPLEKAMEINYARIYNEIVLPQIPVKTVETQEFFTAEPIFSSTSNSRKMFIRTAAALAGIAAGALIAIAGYTLF